MSTPKRFHIKAKRADKSPWFEILLFRTKFRIRLPKSSERHSEEHTDEKIDQRPYVNTVSKENYICNDVLGRCLSEFYQSAWAIYPKGIFTKQIGKLEMKICGLAPARADQTRYPDLYNDDIAMKWISNYYNCLDSFQKDIGAENLPQHYSVVSEEKHGNKIFKANPKFGYVDYFVPFSKNDFVLLSFRILAKKDQQEKLDGIQTAADEFFDGITNTLSLEYPEVKAKGDVGG